jgi:hypothetical protein
MMKMVSPQTLSGLSISHEKQTVNDLLTYAEELMCEEAKLRDERAAEECLNVNNVAPAVLQLKDCERILIEAAKLMMIIKRC